MIPAWPPPGFLRKNAGQRLAQEESLKQAGLNGYTAVFQAAARRVAVIYRGDRACTVSVVKVSSLGPDDRFLSVIHETSVRCAARRAWRGRDLHLVQVQAGQTLEPVGGWRGRGDLRGSSASPQMTFISLRPNGQPVGTLKMPTAGSPTSCWRASGLPYRMLGRPVCPASNKQVRFNADLKTAASDITRNPSGKTECRMTKTHATAQDLSLAYNPGVAEPVREIARDAELAISTPARAAWWQ